MQLGGAAGVHGPFVDRVLQRYMALFGGPSPRGLLGVLLAMHPETRLLVHELRSQDRVVLAPCKSSSKLIRVKWTIHSDQCHTADPAIAQGDQRLCRLLLRSERDCTRSPTSPSLLPLG